MTPSTHLESVADRFGHRVAARLTEGEASLPYVVTERLRASREQALAVRKRPALVTAQQEQTAQAQSIALHADGSASLGQFGGISPSLPNWLKQALTIIPIAAMVVGIAVFGIEQDDSTNVEVAEMDTELLTDTLPPDAYTDAGFIQFLQSQGNHASVN